MRFYCESIDTESFLDPIESNHLSRVLRARKGTPLELFDGQGTLAEGIVEHIGKKLTSVRIQKIVRTPPQHPAAPSWPSVSPKDSDLTGSSKNAPNWASTTSPRFSLNALLNWEKTPPLNAIEK